jgi:two-component system, cell cycle response regulator DivK
MSLRILVVEDNKMNAALARILLQHDGHTIAEAESGAALRALLAHGETADIVLMDIQLPDIDGVTLLADVRAAMPAVPVVALTAHALHGDEARLMASGFEAVMTKPIDTRTFAAKVAEYAAKGRRT